MKTHCTDGLITLVMVRFDDYQKKFYLYKIPHYAKNDIQPGTCVEVETETGTKLGTVVCHPLTCKSGGTVLEFIVTATCITGRIKPIVAIINKIPLQYDESPENSLKMRVQKEQEITAGSGYGYDGGMDD